MSRRKSKAIPTKRGISSPQEEDMDMNTALGIALAEIPPEPPGLNYPTFQRFYRQIQAKYMFGSHALIPSLERIFPRQSRGSGPITNEDFARELCEWTLYYKSDLVNWKDQVIAFINAGSELNNFGLRVGKSTIPNAGMGLFTTKEFVDGEVITKYGGYYSTVDFLEILDLPLEHRNYLVAIPKDNGGGIRDAQVAFRLCDMARWANHTTEPTHLNAAIRVIPNSHPPDFELIAIGNISANTEILWNYGIGMPFVAVNMNCAICENVDTRTMCGACGTPLCGRTCQRKHSCNQ